MCLNFAGTKDNSFCEGFYGNQVSSLLYSSNFYKFNHALMNLIRPAILYFFCYGSFLIMNTVSAQVSNVKTGVWSSPATWQNNHIPTASDSVVLYYDITIDINGSCRALNTNGHKVVVNAGVNLYINRPVSPAGDSTILSKI